ncbi:riboflavin synthase subunit alpha [Marinomonas sp. 15G1-11]|uniref:Riboflavin synthase n=1 Tax=Marinomonas phaeophyticola TaxID=3004091 RepID=A0ABT4JTK9_9GAMM|nr:riboflavin synthase subunit alpha [Marinomonas sp. 15G1-11]MCZ2721670.1 riboflavin synthase subunit alpha [Marinomonas sp. 15G1-11]
MFTGIVQGMAQVSSCQTFGCNKRLKIQFPESSMQGQQFGASVAINGVCLTVVEIDQDQVSFDVIDTTLALTNIGLLEPGARVNFERAARMGDEIGGHVMSGHIMTNVEVREIYRKGESFHIRFSVDTGVDAKVDARRYLFDKGFVGLNGASLTISDIGDDWIEVSLIPETLKMTTFGQLEIGDKVNLEIDSHTQATVDTVERVLKERGVVLP